VIVANPNIGYATLAILVGFGFILNGFGLTALGWGMREVRREVSIPASGPHSAETRPTL
jgi:hypothetical protein